MGHCLTMIIACPACATRYVVPDASIGVEGRTVRCAKCRHSWYQDGPEPDLAELNLPEPKPEQKPETEPEQSIPRVNEQTPLAASRNDSAAYASAPPPASTPVPAFDDRYSAGPSVVEPVRIPAGEPDLRSDFDRNDFGGAEFDNARSQFDYSPPFSPRRNPLKLWTAAAAIFALLAIGTVIAVNFVGLPDWMPVSRPTFAIGQPDLVLDFPPDRQDRRELPNGTEFFGIAGTIKNTGQETRKVPSLWIVLRNARDMIVYNYEVVPPQSSLAPGESMTINDIATDVPKAAKFAEIGWKPA